MIESMFNLWSRNFQSHVLTNNTKFNQLSILLSNHNIYNHNGHKL